MVCPSTSCIVSHKLHPSVAGEPPYLVLDFYVISPPLSLSVFFNIGQGNLDIAAVLLVFHSMFPFLYHFILMARPILGLGAVLNFSTVADTSMHHPGMDSSLPSLFHPQWSFSLSSRLTRGTGWRWTYAIYPKASSTLMVDVTSSIRYHY